MIRRLLLVPAALALAACSISPPGPPAARPESTTTNFTLPTTTSTSTTVTTVAEPPPRPIRPPTPLVEPCPPVEGTEPVGSDPIEASRALVETLICSSSDVIVVEPGAASELLRPAAGLRAPLVYATPDRPYDPASLQATRVWTTSEDLVAGGRHSILPLPEIGAVPPLQAAEAATGTIDETVTRRSQTQSAPAESLVVVSPDQPELGIPAGMAAQVVGATSVWSPPGDMRRRDLLARLARESTSRILVGEFPAASVWQMDVLAEGRQLPGGGQVLFPGRRMVALYGHPNTPGLGALGEQPIDEAIARVQELAAAYDNEESSVLPVFEIIATTASSSPGEDGDYSAELTVEELRPWVEAAAEAGIYVVLDLQPGRTDFLTQARHYEELLRLPHVGLALDPEWRLEADQRHLNQIGSVAGEEVNQVVDWLAGVVRENRLPQKLLVVHQFKLSMIRDREVIRTPPELGVVIHMDGQGPLATKYETWNSLLAAGEGGWRWGWKNFYDEDSPTATPAQILDLDPEPVFISYQ